MKVLDILKEKLVNTEITVYGNEPYIVWINPVYYHGNIINRILRTVDGQQECEMKENISFTLSKNTEDKFVKFTNEIKVKVVDVIEEDNDDSYCMYSIKFLFNNDIKTVYLE